MCRLWYKGQPLVCNLCAKQGHRSANCPNKDKCRHCGQCGHFGRSCPNPWGTCSSDPAAPDASDVAAPGSFVTGVAPGTSAPSAAAPGATSGPGTSSDIEDVTDDADDDYSDGGGHSDDEVFVEASGEIVGPAMDKESNVCKNSGAYKGATTDKANNINEVNVLNGNNDNSNSVNDNNDKNGIRKENSGTENSAAMNSIEKTVL